MSEVNEIQRCSLIVTPSLMQIITSVLTAIPTGESPLISAHFKYTFGQQTYLNYMKIYGTVFVLHYNVEDNFNWKLTWNLVVYCRGLEICPGQVLQKWSSGMSHSSPGYYVRVNLGTVS